MFIQNGKDHLPNMLQKMILLQQAVRRRIQTVMQSPKLAERTTLTAYTEACVKYNLPIIKNPFQSLLYNICLHHASETFKK